MKKLARLQSFIEFFQFTTWFEHGGYKRKCSNGLMYVNFQVNLLTRACPYTQVSELESSSSRLAKFEKCEFTNVNDHFEKEPASPAGGHNAEIGLYRQALTSSYWYLNDK